MNATIPLGRFLGPGQGWHPFEDVWQTQLTYHGMLGQWVVETYDWRIAEQIRDDRSRSWWQLRHIEIVTTVPGASSVDLRFDEA